MKKNYTKSAALKLSPLAIVISTALHSGIAIAATPTVDVNALPQNAQIKHGQAFVEQQGNQLIINQMTNKLIANWDSFDIGANATVTFIQPNADAAVLNRVLSANPSLILGQLSANGRVFLLNPNGVIFGANAQVNAGALVAGAAKLSDSQFIAEQFDFDITDGKTVNWGDLAAAEGGFVTLVGAEIENHGSIIATNGQVALAAGQQVSLKVGKSGLIGIQVDGALAKASIENSGFIAADGGKVWMTSKQAEGVLSHAIHQQGHVQANTLATREGEIWLDADGGSLLQSGTMSAAGTQAHSHGGKVVLTADSVKVEGAIDASGDLKGGDVFVGGGWQGQSEEIREANKTLLTQTGSIDVSAGQAGVGGTAVLWSKERTDSNGAINASGGRSGGQVETSSRGELGVQGSVNVSSESGEAGLWLLDPRNINIVAAPSGSNQGVQQSGDGSSTTPTTYTGTSGTTDAVVINTSIQDALNQGAHVVITTGASDANLGQDGNITIQSDISKTAGGNASLTFKAANNITLERGKNISSTEGKLDVVFDGTTTQAGVKDTNGLIDIQGKIATNGGNAEFYKTTQLSNAEPVSTNVSQENIGGRNEAISQHSGNIVFHEDVILNADNLSVSLAARGAEAGQQFINKGGAVEFKKSVSSKSDKASGKAMQKLIVDTSGKESGAISFAGDIGTKLNPLQSLTLSGPETVTIDSSEINLHATEGNVLTATTSHNTDRVSTLELGADTTTINVTGVNSAGVSGYADYVQSTFDIAAKNPNEQHLVINSDRSIRLEGRTIKADQQALHVELNSGLASTEGGAVIIKNATVQTNGGVLDIGGRDDLAAVGFGKDTSNITDGVYIESSQLDTRLTSVANNVATTDGSLIIRGQAPKDQTGGAGVKIFGRTDINTGNGDLVIEGHVTTASTSGNKDGVILGEGSNSRTLLTTEGGNIRITGDASGVVNAISGSRYIGLVLAQGVAIKSETGDIDLTGRGGNGLYDDTVADSNHGIAMSGLKTSILSQQGEITLDGISGGKTGSYGIYAKGDDMRIGHDFADSLALNKESSGNINLIADDLLFNNDSPSRLQIGSTGELRVRTQGVDRNIEIGTAKGHDKLYLESDYFSGQHTVFVDGFDNISIGGAGSDNFTLPANGQGQLLISHATSVHDNLNLLMKGTGGAITLQGPLTVEGNNEQLTLTIDTQAGVTQTAAAGAITVDKLRILGSGDVLLESSNLVAKLAADLNGALTIRNAQGLEIAEIQSTQYRPNPTSQPAFTDFVATKTSGITTASNQSVSIRLDRGDLTQSRDIHVGEGVLTTQTLAGGVTQTGEFAAKTIAKKVSLDATGSVSLTGQNQIQQLDANITDANQSLKVENTRSLELGEVSVNGDTTINLSAGNLTQAAATKLVAKGVGVTTVGDVHLNNEGNDVDTIAVKTSGLSSDIKLRDKDGLTIGSATSLAGNDISGLTTTSGTIDVQASTAESGDLVIAQSIDTSSNKAEVTLTSGFGGIRQTDGQHSVRATHLTIESRDQVLLQNANDIDSLTASVSAEDQAFKLKDTQGLVIGTQTQSGISTKGNVFLDIEGDLTQTTTANLVAKALGVNSQSGSVVLQNQANDVDTLAVKLNAQAQTLAFNDRDGLDVNQVENLTGIVANRGQVDLSVGHADAGDLTLSQQLDATDGKTRLRNAQGKISSTASGIIQSDSLWLESRGGVELANTQHNVNTLSAEVTGENARFAYQDKNALTVGQVNDYSDAPQNGIRTKNGDIVLTVSTAEQGDLVLSSDSVLDTRVAGNRSADINLSAISGTVTETATTALHSNGLSILTRDSVDMTVATHNIDTLAVKTTGEQANVAFHTNQNLTVGSVDGLEGIQTNKGHVTLTAGNERSAADIRLATSIDTRQDTLTATKVGIMAKGSVIQTGGILDANQVALRTDDKIELTGANTINVVAARNEQGSIDINNELGLSVASVRIDNGNNAQLVGSVDGLHSQSGEQRIQSKGILTLLDNLSALGNTVTINAVGGVTQLGGALTADALRVTSYGEVKLQQQGNDVNTLAATVRNDSFAFYDKSSLEVGKVTSSLDTLTADMVGIQSEGHLLLEAGSNLVLNEKVSAQGQQVALLSEAHIVQGADANIVAKELFIDSQGSVKLASAKNDVEQWVARTNGNLHMTDASELTITALALKLANAQGQIKTVSGVTSQIGSVTVETQSDLTALEAVKAAADVNIKSEAGKVSLAKHTESGFDTKVEAKHAVSVNGVEAKAGRIEMVTEGELNNQSTTVAQESIDLRAASVNLKGDVQSENASITVNAMSGDITVAGKINAGDDIDLTSQGDVSLSETAGAKDAVLIDANGGLTAKAIIAEQGNTAITATGNVEIDGGLSSYSRIDVTAGQAIDISGDVVAQTADVHFNAGSNIKTNNVNAIRGGFSSTAEGSIHVDGDLTAHQEIAITSGQESLFNGVVKSSEGGIAMDSEGNVTFTGNSEMNLVAKRDIVVTSGQESQFNGLVNASEGGIAIDSKGKVTFTGNREMNLIANRDITVTSGEASEFSGGVTSFDGGIAIDSKGTTKFTGDNQTNLLASRDIQVTSGEESLFNGRVMSSEGGVTIDSKGTVTFTGDTETNLIASQDIQVTSGEDSLFNGSVSSSEGNVSIDAKGKVMFAGSTEPNLVANRDISVKSGEGSVFNGVVQSTQGGLSIDSKGTLQLAGRTEANKAVELTAAKAMTIANVSSTTDKVTLQSGSTLTANGTIAALNGVQIESASVAQLQQIQSGGDIIVESKDKLKLNGSVTAQERVFMRSGSDIELSGKVTANSRANNAMVLVSDGLLVNHYGAYALNTPNSRWLVYDNNPNFLDVRGGLPVDFFMIPTTYERMLPVSLTQTGNGYITTANLPNPQQLFRQRGGSVGGTSQGININVPVKMVELSLSQTRANQSMVSKSNVVLPILPAANFGTGSQSIQLGRALTLALEDNIQTLNSDLSALGLGGSVREVTLESGEALPNWLRFNQETQKLEGDLGDNPPLPIRLKLVSQSTDGRESEMLLSIEK